MIRWNREMCISEASKYTTRKDWKKSNQASYNAAIRNCWIGDCTLHMQPLRQTRNFWSSFLNCSNEAKKFTKKSDWAKRSAGSYLAAHKNGWLAECCKHMTDTNFQLLSLIEELKHNNLSIDEKKMLYDKAYKLVGKVSPDNEMLPIHFQLMGRIVRLIK